MKIEKILKKALIILFIILISLISFGGIFVQKTKFVENIIPNYKLGMDFVGSRRIGLAVSEATKTVIYDQDGNIVDEETDKTETVEEAVNEQEILTKENYRKTKKIIENRIKQLEVIKSNLYPEKATDYYVIKQDEKTGKIYLEIPENANTDLIAQYAVVKGTFSICNEDGEVLLNNSHIKNAQVVYGSTNSGTNVYLTIQFNKEGTEILKNITNTYVKTTDEEGNEQTKTIDLKIDDTTVVSTYFEQEIVDGVIQLSIGNASTSSSGLVSYVQEASALAVLLNIGDLPIAYTIEENRYILSNITIEMFLIPAIIVGVILLVGIIALIIKYKKNGLLGAVCLIGYIAVLLLIIRYTNIVITFEGIIGILVSVILDYIFTIYLLNKLENSTFNQIVMKFLFVIIPIAIITVIFSFTNWMTISSLGMTMFWGILLIILYNFIIIKNLDLKN